MRISRIALLAASAASLCAPSSAWADIVAAYAQGYGGMGNGGMSELGREHGSLVPVLGGRVGARVLPIEGYLDYSRVGGNDFISRGIVGMRLGVGAGSWRVEARAGGGVMKESVGAATATASASDLRGLVARAGGDVEKRVGPALLFGVGVEGEYFSLAPENAPPLEPRVNGADVFGSLHLKFELGI